MEKKTLILDLDETLVYSSEENNNLNYDHVFKLEKYNFYTLYRPYLKEFIDFVSCNFNCIIWTSASEDYAQELVTKIFPNKPIILSKSFSNSYVKISDFQLEDINNYSKIKAMDQSQQYWKKPMINESGVYHIKMLKKAIKKYNLNYKNVICIDNDPYKFANAYGNFYAIKDFTGNMNDKELLKFIDLLKELANLKDVRVDKKPYIHKYKLIE